MAHADQTNAGAAYGTSFSRITAPPGASTRNQLVEQCVRLLRVVERRTGDHEVDGVVVEQKRYEVTAHVLTFSGSPPINSIVRGSTFESRLGELSRAMTCSTSGRR